MKSFFLLITCLFGSAVPTMGQCTVSKDAYGQVITTCQVANFPAENAPLNKQLIFLGSEFASFPVWQRGRIRLDQSGQDQACLIAYNLVSNEVRCRFEGDPTEKTVSPYSFVINGVEYVRQLKKVLGVNYTLYTTVLNSGETKLLKSLKGRFVKMPVRNGYDKDNPFAGYFQVDQQYFIQKGDSAPQPISLTKNALLTALEEEREILDAKLSKRQLTPEEVIEVAGLYDSLRVLTLRNSTSLATDAGLKDLLRAHIKYPVQAWNAQVFARVYVGFDITKAGQISNIKLLSPENVGFGFGQEVTTALSKLQGTKPAYEGRYALPVSFMYTAARDKGRVFIPVNTLPDDLLQGRVVLNEVVVNQVMGKDLAKNREVWGYYK
ncbi:hypothetical protein [Larkinella terrae]|uniref:TonB C-terminal domain-containing protein n=1 Tax=Larkinella terrae TaxID=2025311 RepID=A0A7K0EQ20_9BACT|nr:hypothetical protein [Larkinella terrae]MRS63899.1 hypothetical protein [Larkinella terrae]